MNTAAAYSFIGILSIILGLVKEIITIFLLVKGVQVANIYIKKNRGEKVGKLLQDETEDTLEYDNNDKAEIQLQERTEKQEEDDKKDK